MCAHVGINFDTVLLYTQLFVLYARLYTLYVCQEEQCLLYFPCVNCAVAQLLLSRAPSLQWLLEASHTQLEEMFPEITPSIIKVHTQTHIVCKGTSAHKNKLIHTQ